MIKKNKEASLPGQTSNRILGGTSIEGDIKSDGDFRVDGSMKGNIAIAGKLVIGEKGYVEGEVECGSANISGRFDGTLKVAELLSLEASAQVKGDIFTNRLSVVPGADFSGSCSMGAVVRKMEEDEENRKQQGSKKQQERVS